MVIHRFIDLLKLNISTMELSYLLSKITKILIYQIVYLRQNSNRNRHTQSKYSNLSRGMKLRS